MTPARCWILVADGSRARVFLVLGQRRDLEPVDDMEISTDHRRASEMGPDAPGRSFESVGAARHSVAPRTDPERIEEQRFAGLIIERLDQAAGHSRFDKLILVAPPRMLGDLRAALTPRLTGLLAATLAKDLTKIPQARLVGHLEEVLTK